MSSNPQSVGHKHLSDFLKAFELIVTRRNSDDLQKLEEFYLDHRLTCFSEKCQCHQHNINDTDKDIQDNN